MSTLDRLVEKGRKEGIEEGIQKGAERKSYEFVRNLLLETDFTVAKIASLGNVSEAFVQKVKDTLQ